MVFVAKIILSMSAVSVFIIQFNILILGLMIPTPNGRDESGTSRDCYLFNPTWISQSQLTMFRFLGILMGIGKYCEKN